ncbi:MAG: GNAT family N-acetyltransferase, partial [Methanomicrobiales archaeon]
AGPDEVDHRHLQHPRSSHPGFGIAMPMPRRQFLKVMGSGAALGALAPRSFAADGPPYTRHWPAQLIAALEEQYLDIVAISPGTVLHVYQLGIGRQFRNRSISTALIRHVLAFAREQGFKKIVTDCTGPQSCRSFEQCGFTRAGSISYSSFLYRGAAFFDGLEGEITLMVKDL